MISVVIPTLNSAQTLPASFACLVSATVQGLVKEVIVSDGGSGDETEALAEATGARFLSGPKGRGVQLQAGASAARGSWLLFLHSDTVLATGWEAEADAFIQETDRLQAEHQGDKSQANKSQATKPQATKPQSTQRPPRAAAFRFALDERGAGPAFLEAMVGLRCAVFRLPYGDQALLISKADYERLGGFKPLPLMEDVDLVRRIGWRGIRILPARAVTSAARFREGGYVRRPLINLGILSLYFLRVPPKTLARLYGYKG